LVYVIWTDEAIGDLSAIKDYISQSAPETALRFCLSFLDAPDRLEQFPRSGQVVPEFRIESIREIQFRGYRIIYQVGEGACYIRAVVHGSRDLQRHVDPTAWNLT
jgi:addiction module RelE/StbE family toxin